MTAIHWKSGTTGDWSGAVNWDTGVAPAAADSVTIDAAGVYTVAISGADAARSLTVNAAGATVVDTGSLTLAGGLTMTAGQFDLNAGGSVSGGTLSATGGSFAWNGGTLFGDTYQGPLSLTAAGASLNIANGLTLTGAGGTGPGTLDLSGSATSINFLGTQTLDNVVVTDGNAGTGGGGTAIDFGALTLGSNTVLTMVNGNALVSAWAIDVGTSLTNNGTIQTSQWNAGADIVVGTLLNNGLISTTNGGAGFSLQATDFTNNGTLQTLGGGIGISAYNTFTNNGLIVDNGGVATQVTGFTNNGIIDLGGYNTYLAIIGAYTGPTAVGLNGTGTINMTGSLNQLRLLYSQSLQSGTINLSGTGETIEAGPLVTGGTNELILGAQTVINHTAGTTQLGGWTDTLNGTINASGAGGLLTIDPSTLIANGSINVSGGDRVLITSAVTGTGSITLASGGIAEFSGSSASTESAVFTDTSNATLRLDLGAASSFKSVIQGFNSGNVIDLAGITATSATWANGVLTINGSGWGMTGPITLAMAGNYAGATFHIAGDGILATPPGFGFGIYPGSNITVSNVPVAAAPRVYGGTGATISAAEGSAPSGPVATFTDSNLTDTVSQLSATINWGDGTTSAGTVPGGNGAFSIAGTSGHVYAAEGSYATTIAVTNTTDGVTTTLSGGVTATEADVFTPGAATTLAATAGQAFTGAVATFTDGFIANTASDLTATITWGDGTTSAGTITDVNGAISVAGSHNYASAGTDAVSVTLADADGTASATATATAHVVSPFSGAGASVSVAEGSQLTAPIATFTSANAGDTAASFTATIVWGDGTTSAGMVTGGNGGFAVNGGSGHAYAAEGTDTISTTITRTADGSSATIASIATVTEADVFTAGAALALSATAGKAFSGTVATFSDSYLGNTAADLTATITWGDGTTSVGTVTDVNGAISVAGAHSYAAAGSDTLSVVLKDADGTATATASAIATVSAAVITPGNPYALTTHQDQIIGGAGNDTIVAATNTLTNGDVIDGGAGVNTLALTGGGTFNLAVVDTLKNIQIVTAQDGAGTAAQTVTLRENTALTVNVAADPSHNPAAGITIFGAQNTDTINLGSGNAVVTLGVGETITSTGGTNTFKVSSDSISDAIKATGGSNTLEITSGGDMAMGANITGIATVKLDAAAHLQLNGLSFLSAFGSAGADSILAGGQYQTLTGGAGIDSLTGFSGGYDTFRDTAAGLNGDTLRGFVASDRIDLTDMAFGGATLSAVTKSGSTTVTVASGAAKSVFTMAGSFNTAGFHVASDGASGLLLTHS